MEQLRQLYIQWSGKEPAEVKLMAGAGSNRAYYRFFSEDGKTVVGVVGTSVDENKAFIYLSAHFRAQQQPMPEVLAVSEDGMRYLQTDLGGRSLFDALSEGRSGGGTYNEDEIVLLRRTIRSLPGIQIKGAEGLDFMQCYPQTEMDETTVSFDLNYFKYCFLKATYVDFHEMKLEEDFRRMAKDLTEGGLTGFLYRDFQARNVMLDNAGNPYFIDYQGGRRGPVEYDVASFLWQASAHYSPQLRERLIDDYLDALGQQEVNDSTIAANSYITIDIAEILDKDWKKTILAIKKQNPSTTIETLIPDFQGREELISMIIQAQPDIISHNLETVERISPAIRSIATYEQSLKVIRYISEKGITTKSGIMVGLGETPEEVEQTMDDLLQNGCHILTIGQYLQPTAKHYPVFEYIHPKQFALYKHIGEKKGFRCVESGPLIRSSYHAEKHITYKE